jgi:hypothetical protein
VSKNHGENHGKMGKSWENHGKMIGKPWENNGKMLIAAAKMLEFLGTLELIHDS